MKLAELITSLDDEFPVTRTGENLIEWAVTEANRSLVHADFLERKTGLLLKSSDEIDKVYTAVFVTDAVVQRLTALRKRILLFTHHHFDYYEDKRGMQPISFDNLSKLKEGGVSIFVAHASLDTHPIYGTSRALARLLNIWVDEPFFDYFGAAAAVTGHIDRAEFYSFAEQAKQKLQRPYLTLIKNGDFIKKVAVVAGGGDIPELLQQSYDRGCDTLITGTIEHRWELPAIQKANKEFHDLNNRLSLNLIGGTHFATERPAMKYVLDYFKQFAICAEYCEDELLLNAE